MVRTFYDSNAHPVFLALSSVQEREKGHFAKANRKCMSL